MSENKEILNFNPKKLLYSEYNDIVSKFSCGEDVFDTYLNKEALDDRLNGRGVTYIVIDQATKSSNKKDEDKNPLQSECKLVAYYTISTSTVHFIDAYDFEDADIPEPEKRKHYSPISAVIINMFAVNNEYQDCIYEEELVSSLVLQSLISDIYDITTNIIGAKMIILCSVPDAVDFYKRNNFKEFPKEYTIFDYIDLADNKAMYLTLHDS